MALSSRLFMFGVGSLVVAAAAAGACSASGNPTGFDSSSTGGAGAGGGSAQSVGGSNAGNSGTGGIGFDAGNMDGGGTGGGMVIGDPTTCAEAAANKTYIGCDFWPTVTANIVWSVFDFTVVVANAGMTTANVTVTGPGVNQMVQVAPNALEKVYLPWVPSLKGGDADDCGHIPNTTNGMGSVYQKNGAYHLVSDVPITVYQFSALEYAPKGGAAGKDWSTCPATQCATLTGCFSYTNDASLLLPTTAMTGDYRIGGQAGWPGEEGAFFAITATQANTNVTVYVAPKGHVLAGGVVADTPGGGMVTFALNMGDVAELFSDSSSDNAGSLVKADKPVQVISGMPCAFQPFNIATPACDHLEQTVLPAETLGKHYFVSPPTSPHNTVVGHIVRIIGNVDGTNLTYQGNPPMGAPSTINAGQVVDLTGAMGYVTQPFEIKGDHEFEVSTFMLSGLLTDPNAPMNMALGDPSQSNAVTVEQYRKKYVFLAPDDYTESYADITMPTGAVVMIDGAAIAANVTPISSGFGIARVQLGAGNGGAHVLTSMVPVGLQVIGYGQYTSYQYPGGLNLDVIAPPPPPPPPPK